MTAQTLVIVDVDRRTVQARRNGVTMSPVVLTPKELDLLIIIAEAKGKVVSREHLMRVIWGIDIPGGIESRTIDQHIARLRRSLGSARKVMTTVTNYGYAVYGGVDLHAAKDIIGPVRKVQPVFHKGQPFLDVTVRIPHPGVAPREKQTLRLAEVL